MLSISAWGKPYGDLAGEDTGSLLQLLSLFTTAMTREPGTVTIVSVERAFQAGVSLETRALASESKNVMWSRMAELMLSPVV